VGCSLVTRILGFKIELLVVGLFLIEFRGIIEGLEEVKWENRGVFEERVLHGN
jgi:hypothetical protein